MDDFSTKQSLVWPYSQLNFTVGPGLLLANVHNLSKPRVAWSMAASLLGDGQFGCDGFVLTEPQ